MANFCVFFITLTRIYYFELYFCSSKYFSYCVIIPEHGFNVQIKAILFYDKILKITDITRMLISIVSHDI